MNALMQNFPLIIPRLLNHAEKNHSRAEIVSRRLEGDIHRYSFADMIFRSKQLANSLDKLGVRQGEVIGTIAWNGYRHMELYCAVPGSGAVYHTINPRLSIEQLAYVINHAEDRYLFVEAMFLPLLEEIVDELKKLEGIIVLCDEGQIPETSIPNIYCYEQLLSEQPGDYEWKDFDENLAAGICYTSGTTGNPKGVVYSHRALVLQAMNTAIGLEISSLDSILPIVPMFHVNAWTLPYMVLMLGNKFVLPGRELDGESVFTLLDKERITISAGVPTVWQMLLDYLEDSGKDLTHLRKMMVGGSAPPRKMLETFSKRYQVEPLHAWGMTETTAMGSTPTTSAELVALGDEAIMNAKLKQGRAVFGAEIRVIDEHGNEQPRDGKSAGNLTIRGWSIASAYLKGESSEEFLEDGWFDTGDIATIDPEGYLQLTDRAKDVIKSGGEWISSIDLENAACGHPDVESAAVIAIPHPKWEERPLLLVVLKAGAQLDKAAIQDYLEGKVSKWWLPDDIIQIDELPIGATGKVQKNLLREQYQEQVAGGKQ